MAHVSRRRFACACGLHASKVAHESEHCGPVICVRVCLHVCACTGEVAGLLPKDELDMIVNDIRPIMKSQAPGIPDTWENLYNFFLNRVRDNLHMVLCFSPVGNKFSRRAQQFPGLINGCTIDW